MSLEDTLRLGGRVFDFEDGLAGGDFARGPTSIQDAIAALCAEFGDRDGLAVELMARGNRRIGVTVFIHSVGCFVLSVDSNLGLSTQYFTNAKDLFDAVAVNSARCAIEWGIK